MKPPDSFNNDHPSAKAYAQQFATKYEQLARSRSYAFDNSEENWLGGAALARAVDAERTMSFDKVLEAMNDAVDEKFASTALKKLPPPIPKFPEPALDPVTKQPLPNPRDEPDEAKRAHQTAGKTRQV
jgi:hypothetical protein